MKATDVAVVGAGPAGVAAALAAASLGVQTTLINETAHVGGNLKWRIATIDGLPSRFDDLNGDRAFKVARELEELVKKSQIEFLDKGTAWGWFEDNVLAVVQRDDSHELKAKSIVVATGSTDIMRPFPGSTLPGVTTARAVLIFLHIHRVLPGRRFAIIGEGQDADEVNAALEMSGAEVVCRVKDLDGVKVAGDREVSEIQLPERSFGVDSVVVALGRQPDAELALHALAQSVFSAGADGIVPRRNESCETSVPGLFVAGEAAGICAVGEAMAEGWLAGLAAAGAGGDALSAARNELSSLRGANRQKIVEDLRLKAASIS
ncbi:MAG: FAD-dependent oxidoreductase [Nitrolancea sp.]